MTASSYFFRVEHDLLRSEAFKTLGGSAIKVYLVIGLYSDFGTDWAYPSIRTIARQAGLSRQTVLSAVERTHTGRIACNEQIQGTLDSIPNHSPGPQATKPLTAQDDTPDAELPRRTSPNSLDVGPETGPIFLEPEHRDCSRGWTGAGPTLRRAWPRH